MCLNDADLSLVIHSLAVAADKYRANAKEMTEIGHKGLADTFIRQAVDADRIMALLESQRDAA